jgi:GT2 family glycosyltransferase
VVDAPSAASDPAAPTVSVIVPVKDGADLLARCVGALVTQDYPAELIQILVVDNGSAVSPSSVLPEDPRVILLEEPEPGSYRARNLALQHATGEIVAFTDADCLPATDWISAAVAYLRAHPECAMIGGRVDIRFRSGRPVNGPEWFESVQGFPQERYVATGFAVTANMVTRRSVLEKVGPFAESLQSGGDAEWGRRVRDAGLGQAYVDTAAVGHPARDTWAEIATKARRTTQGVVDRTRSGSGSPRPRLARLLAGQLANTVRTAATVWWQPGLPDLRARLAYLGTRIRVNAVTAGVLARAMLGRDGR